jgi:hypothetical protein
MKEWNARERFEVFPGVSMKNANASRVYAMMENI